MRMHEFTKKFNVAESIAREGDWRKDESHIGTLSAFMFEKTWIAIDDIQTLEKTYTFAKHGTMDSYILGTLEDINKNGEIKKAFDIVLKIDLTKQDKLESVLPYKNLYRVNEVFVRKDKRGMGIATEVYIYLVNNGMSLIGDREQYFGARKLWSNLSKNLDVVVDLVDLSTNRIIYTDVVLHHGQYDEDFDNRLWDYGYSKETVRPILKLIK